MFSDPAINLSKLGLIEGMKVVDVGAGSGFYTMEAVRRVGASGRVYAIDVQKDLLERIRSNAIAQSLSNIEVIWGDAERIGGTKLREGLADRIIASNLLTQLEKKDEFCLELKRILKIDGKILLIDWSDVSTFGPKDVVPAQKAQILFEKAGFKLEESFSAGDHHYGLIFRK